MIDRIAKNENRLDSAKESIKLLEEALDLFENNKKNIRLLNNYYGSNNWFKDKENLEKGIIPRVKAGVLSEDEVWNMNEDIKKLIKKMKRIIREYEMK